MTTLPTTLAAPTAEAGRASALVSWPKSGTGTVTGYTVYANPGPATCTTTSADDTSCVIGATEGVSYTYTVAADSPAGSSAASVASNPIVASAPLVPASAPTSAPTTVTTTDGVLSEVRAGQQITFLGEGFLPYSSVSIILYSSPVVLGTAVTDADGAFARQVTMPTDLAVGSHNLVASGVDAAGSTHLIRMPVTVAATTTGDGGTSGTSGSGGSGTTGLGGTTGSTSGGGSLAYTGAPVLRLAIWAALLTGAGLALFLGGRCRRPAQVR